MPSITCPQCNQEVSVSISQAGAQVPCPGCEATIQVPKLGDLKRLTEAAAAANPHSHPPLLPSESADNQTTSRVLFGGALAMVGLSAIVATFCLVRYLSIEVPVTTEMHIEEIDRTYHSVSAAQLIREWQQMEKNALDVAFPYNYKKSETEKARWARNTAIAGAVSAAGILLAVFLGLADSRRRAPG